jgi:hypothetical protein
VSKLAVRVKFDVKGDLQVAADLNGIKTGVQNRVLKDAIGKLARRTAKRAKAGLRGGRTKALKRSVGTVYRSYKKAGRFAYVVGPRTGFKTKDQFGRTVDPAKYAHLVEGGRKEVRPTKKRVLAVKSANLVFGIRARAVPAAPFVGPAADDAAAAFPGVLRNEVPEGIRREAAKYAKKGKSIRG